MLQTVKEIKRYILSLIEEYSTNDLYNSDDEDINKRLIPLINIHYQLLMNQKGVEKKKRIEVKIEEDIERDEYIPYSISSMCEKFMGIHVVRSDYKDIDYYFLNNKLYIKNNYEGVIDVFYKKYPEDLSDIANDKIDDTQLEIDINLAIILCYHVASDILKTDVGSDYMAFEEKASKVISAMDIYNNNVVGIVKNINLYGGGL